MGLDQQARIRSRRPSGRVHDHDERVSQPRSQTHRQNPGPSSPNEPGGIFTANVKGGELANRCCQTAEEVIATAQVGMIRVRRDRQLPLSFLRHTGLTL